MNQTSPGPGRQAPAGPNERNADQSDPNAPSELDAMPPRSTDDEPKSNESIERGPKK